ncbi:MAG: rRNA maturation RNase YbeY [Vicingaceae bacterium]|nr:rRNA maturation RNase YbeY [Vicingaceae bacterium]
MSLSSSISFYSEDTSFELKNTAPTIDWIHKTILSENKVLGEISYIFCSDDFLHKINLEHLDHDTYTDIITFNYCEKDILNSDIFISIDRVKENAKTYNVDFINELHRVIVHGVLHLVGYNDKTDEQQEEMTAKEDFYLSLLKN